MDDFLEFHGQQSDVVIDEEMINIFATRFLDEHVAAYMASASPIHFPLQFPSLQEEVNLLAMKELLMVGGMFEHAAHTAGQESLGEVILFGLIGAFLTEPKLNSVFMRNLSASDVASLFSLPITEKEDISPQYRDSSIASILTVEKRGGLADYADMLANVAYKAGTALKDNEHPDLSSLLEKENLECANTSLELASRNLTGVIQTLDDRHFVSIKREEGNEQMVELPFLKNARRMVCSVYLKRCQLLHDVDCMSSQVPSKLNDMIAAPSVRTINALLRLGILSRRGDVLEDHGEYASVTSGRIGKEVAMRCAAVVACWQLSRAIKSIAASRNLSVVEFSVNPIQLSIYLESSLNSDFGDQDVKQFIPHETGQAW